MAKIHYSKQATNVQQQINLLLSRNVTISDQEKAKEYLLDIGYYRLGFYSYPFELTFPKLDRSRRHDVQIGTRIEDIVAFYYFDFDMRNILNRYLSRIEIAIRTTIIYELSNKYSSDPYWYVNPAIVDNAFVSKFTEQFYPMIKTKEPIKRHHKKYFGQYAPAWKAMEYMTFGNLEILYTNLLSTVDKSLISRKFNEPSFASFENYLSVVREVRNSCAHGNVIALMKLSFPVQRGLASPYIAQGTHNKFLVAIKVIDFLLRQISVNRAEEMWQEIYGATKKMYAVTPSIRPLIEQETGIILPLEDSKHP